MIRAHVRVAVAVLEVAVTVLEVVVAVLVEGAVALVMAVVVAAAAVMVVPVLQQQSVLLTEDWARALATAGDREAQCSACPMAVLGEHLIPQTGFLRFQMRWVGPWCRVWLLTELASTSRTILWC
jgi:hypothetical protein